MTPDQLDVGAGIAGLTKLRPGGSGNKHGEVHIKGDVALQRLPRGKAHCRTFGDAHFEKGLRITGSD
jgi:hypothetical protein